jgi:hypothetical protein
MNRSRLAWALLLVPILFVALASTYACGGSSEEPTVQNFFRAARMRDNVTQGNIAIVGYDPKTDGQVDNFSFVSETPEQLTPIQLKQLAAALKDAQKADEEFTNKKRDYQDANADAVKRVLDAEKKNQKLGGKDAVIQAAWSKWREDTQASAKKVTEAREALNKERPAIELSMQNPQKPIDATEYDGQLATKEMTIAANVKDASGQASKKTLVITLQQARLKGSDGAELKGKWVITKVKPAA